LVPTIETLVPVAMRKRCHNSQALRPVSVGRTLQLPPFELRV
jgi:hypothetical protein